MSDKWMYSDSEDSDYWNFADSRDEAIGEAQAYADDTNGDHYVIAKAEKQKRPCVNAQRVLEDIDEQFYDETGCEDDIFVDVKKEHIDELSLMLNGTLQIWMDKHGYDVPNWYMPVDIEKFEHHSNSGV